VNDIEEKLNYIIKLLEMNNNVVIETEEDTKVSLWLHTTSPKVIGFTYRIPESSHIKFKQKCIEEGWSLQEGISRLIQAFIEDRIEIKS